MSKCEHQFELHYGIRVFNKTGVAWVQWKLVKGSNDELKMYRCVKCGEEGYEVPA